MLAKQVSFYISLIFIKKKSHLFLALELNKSINPIVLCHHLGKNVLFVIFTIFVCLWFKSLRSGLKNVNLDLKQTKTIFKIPAKKHIFPHYNTRQWHKQIYFPKL